MRQSPRRARILPESELPGDGMAAANRHFFKGLHEMPDWPLSCKQKRPKEVRVTRNPIASCRELEL